jgi:hypothetical protein
VRTFKFLTRPVRSFGGTFIFLTSLVRTFKFLTRPVRSFGGAFIFLTSLVRNFPSHHTRLTGGVLGAMEVQNGLIVWDAVGLQEENWCNGSKHGQKRCDGTCRGPLRFGPERGHGHRIAGLAAGRFILVRRGAADIASQF